MMKKYSYISSDDIYGRFPYITGIVVLYFYFEMVVSTFLHAHDLYIMIAFRRGQLRLLVYIV